jgi:hypothetical protein
VLQIHSPGQCTFITRLLKFNYGWIYFIYGSITFCSADPFLIFYPLFYVHIEGSTSLENKRPQTANGEQKINYH